MHIIIGIITAIAGFFWALHSLQNAGVDLNAFNPFTWARRRKWEKQLGTKPRHTLTNSMDAAALLVVAISKQDGEITRETKLEVLSIFESEFGVSRSKAIEMFSSSTYLLNDVVDMISEVKPVLEPSKSEFQVSHTNKLVKMLIKVANIETGISINQDKIIQGVKETLLITEKKASNW